jgi:hypothetical protein
MMLRICDGRRSRVVVASLEVVEQVFAPDGLHPAGTEISLADGERWLSGIVIDVSQADGYLEPVIYLVSAQDGAASQAGWLDRAEVIHRFQQFLLDSVAPATQDGMAA